MRKLIILVFLTVILLYTISFSQDQRERFPTVYPFKGLWSAFSKFTIPENALTTAENILIDEQGVIKKRPGFYNYKPMDYVSTITNVIDGYEYTKQIEGGSNSRIILYIDTNNYSKLYYTTNSISTNRTDISGALSFNKSGVPVFSTYQNRMFMANGQDNPVHYFMDGNVTRIGYAVFTDTNFQFINPNSILIKDGAVWTTDFNSSMKAHVTNSGNNNATYEFTSLDANYAYTREIVTNEYDKCNITGYSIPDGLYGTRTETVTIYSPTLTTFYDNPAYSQHYIGALGINFTNAGIFTDSNITVSGTALNDGIYKVTGLPGSFIAVDRTVIAESLYSQTVTFTGSRITLGSNFIPTIITGHKNRMFAAGNKANPTYLYISVCRLFSNKFYDIWRDHSWRYEGSDYIDMEDKITALVPEFNDVLIIGCENSIWKLQGDDVGSNLIDSMQGYIFSPRPIVKGIGIVSPKAYCRVGNDIYFMADTGLYTLSNIEQYGNISIISKSSPVSDLNAKLKRYNASSDIEMEYIPSTNLIYIKGAVDSDANSIIVYNPVSENYTLWKTKIKPVSLFVASSMAETENPSVTYSIDILDSKYYQTLYMGDPNGKIWAMNERFSYDKDYSNPNSPVSYPIVATIETGKINCQNIFVKKNFQKAILMIKEQNNFSSASYGSFTLSYKLDNGNYTSTTSNFSSYTDTNNTAIDYYIFPYFILSGNGNTIQYKIISSDKFGFELSGILTEYNKVSY